MEYLTNILQRGLISERNESLFALSNSGGFVKTKDWHPGVDIYVASVDDGLN